MSECPFCAPSEQVLNLFRQYFQAEVCLGQVRVAKKMCLWAMAQNHPKNAKRLSAMPSEGVDPSTNMVAELVGHRSSHR